VCKRLKFLVSKGEGDGHEGTEWLLRFGFEREGGCGFVAGCWGEEKIQSLEGAGGFFFLGLEISLGLGCFLYFSDFFKIDPPLWKFSVA